MVGEDVEAAAHGRGRGDDWIAVGAALAAMLLGAWLLTPLWSPWALDLIARRGLWEIATTFLIPALVGVGGTAVAAASWRTSQNATKIAQDALDAEHARAAEAKQERMRDAGARRSEAMAAAQREQSNEMDRRVGAFVEALYRYRAQKKMARKLGDDQPDESFFVGEMRLVSMVAPEQDVPAFRAVQRTLLTHTAGVGEVYEDVVENLGVFLVDWRRGASGLDKALAVEAWAQSLTEGDGSVPDPYPEVE